MCESVFSCVAQRIRRGVALVTQTDAKIREARTCPTEDLDEASPHRCTAFDLIVFDQPKKKAHTTTKVKVDQKTNEKCTQRVYY